MVEFITTAGESKNRRVDGRRTKGASNFGYLRQRLSDEVHRLDGACLLLPLELLSNRRDAVEEYGSKQLLESLLLIAHGETTGRHAEHYWGVFLSVRLFPVPVRLSCVCMFTASSTHYNISVEASVELGSDTLLGDGGRGRLEHRSHGHRGGDHGPADAVWL